MVKENYQVEFGNNESKIAKARYANANASIKFATEIAREIKGKRLDWAEKWLNRVMEHTDYIPLRVYHKKVPHRKGDSKSFGKAGRYADKTTAVFLKLLKSVKANADVKGLDADNLMVIHTFVSTGFRRVSHQTKGKISGKMRQAKSAHIEIAVREAK